MSLSFEAIAEQGSLPKFVGEQPVIAVQGLGFVGAAMATAVASAVDSDGSPRYRVIGVDLADVGGQRRIAAINGGVFPFETVDQDLTNALAAAAMRGNLVATSTTAAYALAEVIVIDVPLDIDWRSQTPTLLLGGFEAAIATVGRHVQPGALVLVETTVPPGTTQKIVQPILDRELMARGLDPSSVFLAHSYERVMPGADYFASIVDFWRVFAGATPQAGDRAEAFLSSVINTAEFPMTRLSNTTASETAKVLENTYRATTIALMDEWARFAETVGVDLYEIVEAIRVRPTHNNMRTPGFGVGGYCLTKDPLFAKLAASELFGVEMEFPFSTAAVKTNDLAPAAVVDRLEQLLGGSLASARLLLAGVSYRQDVGDTRYSPAETFVRIAQQRGATVVCHDPLVEIWEELDLKLDPQFPAAEKIDAVVFAVPHREYRELNIAEWLGGTTPIVFDAFGVLSAEQRSTAVDLGCVVTGLGQPTVSSGDN